MEIILQEKNTSEMKCSLEVRDIHCKALPINSLVRFCFTSTSNINWFRRQAHEHFLRNYYPWEDRERVYGGGIISDSACTLYRDVIKLVRHWNREDENAAVEEIFPDCSWRQNPLKPSGCDKYKSTHPDGLQILSVGTLKVQWCNLIVKDNEC